MFWNFKQFKLKSKKAKTNSADPDQTAFEEAVWFGSSLFDILTSSLWIRALLTDILFKKGKRKVFEILDIYLTMYSYSYLYIREPHPVFMYLCHVSSMNVTHGYHGDNPDTNTDDCKNSLPWIRFLLTCRTSWFIISFGCLLLLFLSCLLSASYFRHF